jgi:predicted HTH domain antitoxin
MEITIEVPDDIANALQLKSQDMPRRVLESLALEGYRSGALSDGQLRRLLNFETRFEVHGFLKDHNVPLNYSMEDLESDRRTHDRLGI